MKRIIFLSLTLVCSLVACQAEVKKEQKNQKSEQKMELEHLTRTTFKEKVADYEASPTEWKYEGDKPCIVDFYATWCGPCKTLAPILEELAKEYAGQIDIYKVDVDKEQELAAVFGIQSIPTLLFCPQKEAPQIARGLLPKADLKKTIDEVLLGKR